MCAQTSFINSPRTAPLTVKNVGFILEKLGHGCEPLQFLRELTQNAIEAISAAKVPGEIIWDVDWNWYELNGAYKLSVSDTGVGMTGAEMVDFINKLSSSVHEQSLDGNFGIGAKIAAAPRNKYGVKYLSWKNGSGAMIHFWRDPSSGIYGLKQFERQDQTFREYIEVEDDIKPEGINRHGTMVILLGNKEDENTMQAPAGSPAPSRWIAKYLNSRYFQFPDIVTVKAREGWEYPRSDGDRNKLRTVTGQSKYLAQRSTARGHVPLENAIAHWWILENTDALAQESNYYASLGHVAALYKNELYEMSSGRSATAQLQQFGVIFGSRRVVIYIEPQPPPGVLLAPDASRTKLLLDSEPLPWAEWFAQFREQMPREIEELVRESAPGGQNIDQAKSIRDRLKPLLELFKLSRYRLSARGPLFVDEGARTRGGRANSERNTDSPTETKGKPGGKGGSDSDIYVLFEKRAGARGEKVEADIFPKVQWISLSDGSRNAGDLEDRAARYIRDQNLLLMNVDFRGFNDIVQWWCKELKSHHDTVGIKQIVQDIVQVWFQQALVETVIRVQALEGSPEWNAQQIQQALSEEALTASCMQLYHIHVAVKRELGAKLGKLSAA